MAVPALYYVPSTSGSQRKVRAAHVDPVDEEFYRIIARRETAFTHAIGKNGLFVQRRNHIHRHGMFVDIIRIKGPGDDARYGEIRPDHHDPAFELRLSL